MPLCYVKFPDCSHRCRFHTLLLQDTSIWNRRTICLGLHPELTYHLGPMFIRILYMRPSHSFPKLPFRHTFLFWLGNRGLPPVKEVLFALRFRPSKFQYKWLYESIKFRSIASHGTTSTNDPI